MNLQRLINNKSLTLLLMKNKDVVGRADLDIGKPMIAVADLWNCVSLKCLLLSILFVISNFR